MGKPRATYDQGVIDAWAAKLASRKQGTGKVLVGIAIVMASLLALAVVTNMGLFVVLFFCAAPALIVAMLVDRGRLLCPNCGRCPFAAFERRLASHVDFCAHCSCWLKSPYATDRPGDA